MFERLLTLHCAPTLAGIKTANLFSCRLDAARARCITAQWDKALRGFGLRVQLLHEAQGLSLIYVYRPSRLACELAAPETAAFLAAYGYPAGDLAAALSCLHRRIAQQGGFPHEIGLFLGYPLADVRGFIEHQGRNYRCCGCWKVYGDECAARVLFARYAACTEAYTRLYKSGRRVTQLAVAG